MINLGLLKPALKAVIADHVQIKLERGESAILVKMKIWDNRVTLTIHTPADKITVAWTEAGQWQCRDMTYAQVEQWIADELN